MMPDITSLTTDQNYKMANGDYPSLWAKSDKASFKAQRLHLWLQRMYLTSLVAGGIIGSITAFVVNNWGVKLYIVTAIVLTIGFVILLVIRSQQYDKIWFDCRAVAESVKTATWRFMMHTPPFRDDASVDKKFILELQEIRKARPGVEKHLAGTSASNPSEITSFMKQIRSLSFEQRKILYLKDRVHNQKSWYSDKAKNCTCAASTWFWGIIALQTMAVVLSIIQASVNGLSVNLVTVLTTCAAALVAWNQTKRNDELVQSYSLASQELSEMESIASNIDSENEFTQLVEQVEEAISREHTLWCARRDVRLSERGRDKTT